MKSNEIRYSEDARYYSVTDDMLLLDLHLQRSERFTTSEKQKKGNVRIYKQRTSIEI